MKSVDGLSYDGCAVASVLQMMNLHMISSTWDGASSCVLLDVLREFVDSIEIPDFSNSALVNWTWKTEGFMAHLPRVYALLCFPSGANLARRSSAFRSHIRGPTFRSTRATR